MDCYIQGQGLISQRRGSNSYFYHYDGLGSTKALTDSNQNVQANYKYDAWGNVVQTSGTITNPYLYVGELGYYADGGAGMYLLTQRWYNSVVGRFVVRDALKTLGISGVMYLYGEDNPTMFTDPAGSISIPSLPTGMWICIGCLIGHLTIPGSVCLTECIKPSMGWDWIKDCLGLCIQENYGDWLKESLKEKCGLTCAGGIISLPGRIPFPRPPRPECIQFPIYPYSRMPLVEIIHPPWYGRVIWFLIRIIIGAN